LNDLATINERFKVKNGINVSVPNGTAPIVTPSSTLNENLNADLLDGQHGDHYLDWTNTTNKPDPTITLGGDLSGSVTLTDVGDGTLNATINPDSVALGTDTTGNYVATITGTTNQVNVSGSGSETAAVTLSTPQDIHSEANPTFAGATLDKIQVGITSTNEIDTVSGNLTIDSFGGTVTVDDNLIVEGNLTVNGTTTTLESIVAVIKDPVLLLGGETPPEESDAKDRGIEFRWHDEVDPQIGFFGFDHSTGRFTFIPYAENDGEIFSGDVGGLDADHIQFATSPNAIVDVARFVWDEEFGTLDLGLKGGNTVLQLGQEIVAYVHSDDETTINKGDVVSITGSEGNNVCVVKSIATGEISATHVLGIATEEIEPGQKGFVTIKGSVQNLDTYIDGDSEGAEIWLSKDVAGAWTTTRPSAPNQSVRIGYIQKEDEDGTIFVNVQVSAGTLALLYDVQLSETVSDYDVLRYDEENGYWVNTDISTVVNSIETIDAQNIVVSGNLTVETDGFIEGDLDVDGDVNIDGGSITTSAETFNLLNTDATTINFGGEATDIQVGSSTGTTNINNNLNVDGNELSSTSNTFTVLDTPTTIDFGAAATDIQIGAATGTTNINNDLDVDGDVNIDGGDLTVSTTTFNLANTTATTINLGGDATDIQIGSNTGTTNVNNDLDVDGDLNIDGGNLTVSATTFNLANTNATTVNFAGAATSIEIGSSTGTTNINNDLDVDGDLNVDGGDFTTSSTTFNLLNNTATSVNFAGAATSIEIGSSTGTTNINNDLDVDGDINIDGGDLTTSATTFNLANTNATNINFGGEATSIQIGSIVGTTRIKNDLDVDGDLNVDGGDFTTSQATFNLLNNTATTLNIGGAATTVEIGAATGTTNVNNNLDVDLDLNIDGGDLTTSATTFNLLNNTATTINFGGAATTVEIGSSSGTTNVNNNLDVDGDINIDGGDITASTTSFNLLNNTVTSLNLAGAATAITVGATTGETQIRHSLQVDGSSEFFGPTNTFNPPTASPPFVLGSNALNRKVIGLNADLLDDQDGSWYQARANHTGTQLSSTISNFVDTTQQTVAPMFVHSQHVNLTASYNNVSKRVILTATGGGGGGGGGTDFSLTYWMGV
jgi:hypothetical protein